MGYTRVNDERLAALRLDLGGELVGRLLALVVVDHDLRPVLGELLRDSAAEAAGATGDDGDLIVQAGHKDFPRSCRYLARAKALVVYTTRYRGEQD